MRVDVAVGGPKTARWRMHSLQDRLTAAVIGASLTAWGCGDGTATAASGAGGSRGPGPAGAGGTESDTGGAAGSGPGGPALALHVQGRELRDTAGHTVVLRGVNQHGFLDVPDGGWDASGEALYSGMGQWRPEVVQETLDEYRRLGFNVVRFHTIVDWWKTDPDTYRDPYREVTYAEPYRSMLEEVVTWAEARGLYVIFDFFALRNDDGVQSGQESLPWAPWGSDPAVVADRAEYVEIWDSVAETLGEHPNVLFELYNEPHGDAETEAEWFRFVDEVVPVVRARSDNLVIVQWDYMCWVNLDYPPPQYEASTLGWIERHSPSGEGLVFGTHFYRNSGGGGSGSVHRTEGGLVNLWERADIEAGLEAALFREALDDWDVPLLVTEIGAYLSGDDQDQSQEVQWLDNALSVLNEWNVGYVGWAWRSDEQLDHGMLHDGEPNAAGEAFLASLPER